MWLWLWLRWRSAETVLWMRSRQSKTWFFVLMFLLCNETSIGSWSRNIPQVLIAVRHVRSAKGTWSLFVPVWSFAPSIYIFLLTARISMWSIRFLWLMLILVVLSLQFNIHLRRDNSRHFQELEQTAGVNLACFEDWKNGVMTPGFCRGWAVIEHFPIDRQSRRDTRAQP